MTTRRLKIGGFKMLDDRQITKKKLLPDFLRRSLRYACINIAPTKYKKGSENHRLQNLQNIGFSIFLNFNKFLCHNSFCNHFHLYS